MQGKHAPESPRSFYLSLARFFGMVFGGVALLLLAILIAVRDGDGGRPTGSRPGPSPSATASESAPPSPTPTPAPTETVRPPSQVTAVVLNGTRRNGLAGRVRDQLQAKRYRVRAIGNASATEQTTVYYQPGAEAEARALVEAFPELGRVAPATSSMRSDVLLTIVLGADYPS